MRRNFNQKWKKLCAAVLAAGMVVTSCPAGVWGAVGDQGKPENGCLKISNRNGGQDGPMQSIAKGTVKTTNSYACSAKVKYIDGAETEKEFKLTIQNGPSWEYREVIGSVKAKKGEWAEIKVDNYQPKEKYTVGDKDYAFSNETTLLFVETGEDKGTFYIDDMSMIDSSDSNKEIISNGTFEANADGWERFSAAWPAGTSNLTWMQEKDMKEEVAPAVKEKNPNNNCLGVLNRTAEGKGVGFKVNGLATGQTYSISAQIMCLSGSDTRTINATMQCGPDWKHRNIVKAATVKKGEWTQRL